jgi:hypothetical protein
MTGNMYSQKDLEAMSPEQFAEARAAGFVKPFAYPTTHRDAVEVSLPPLSPQAQDQRLGEVIYGPDYQAPSADKYAVTTWGSNLYDFTTPSGQTCQLKKFRPEDLLGTSLLDRITRLPAFADEAIKKAEGTPPVKALPEAKQIEALIEVLNDLLPIVIAQPTVHATPKDPDERVEGQIYVDDIELADRIAIMNRAVQGVSKFDNFRKEP